MACGVQHREGMSTCASQPRGQRGMPGVQRSGGRRTHSARHLSTIERSTVCSRRGRTAARHSRLACGGWPPASCRPRTPSTGKSVAPRRGGRRTRDAHDAGIANVLFVMTNLLAAWRLRSWKLMVAALLCPLYWVLISVGSWKGLLQLFTRPFFWEKTRHGTEASSMSRSYVA
jgi:hypothetical protein